jgi:hypothetical protein
MDLIIPLSLILLYRTGDYKRHAQFNTTVGSNYTWCIISPGTVPQGHISATLATIGTAPVPKVASLP